YLTYPDTSNLITNGFGNGQWGLVLLNQFSTSLAGFDQEPKEWDRNFILKMMLEDVTTFMGFQFVKRMNWKLGLL
ncbi:Hypothetical predicted protein, partial [Olea europaea subsp. europaea]